MITEFINGLKSNIFIFSCVNQLKGFHKNGDRKYVSCVWELLIIHALSKVSSGILIIRISNVFSFRLKYLVY